MCSGEGGWSPWSHGPCSRNCGNGTRTSTRKCTTPDLLKCCPGNSTIIEACEERKCSGEQVVLSIFTIIRGNVLYRDVRHASSSLWERDDSPGIWQLSIVSNLADILVRCTVLQATTLATYISVSSSLEVLEHSIAVTTYHVIGWWFCLHVLPVQTSTTIFLTSRGNLSGFCMTEQKVSPLGRWPEEARSYTSFSNHTAWKWQPEKKNHTPEKEPGAWTRSLCPNAEFQPPVWPRFFISPYIYVHRPAAILRPLKTRTRRVCAWWYAQRASSMSTCMSPRAGWKMVHRFYL